MSLVSGFTIVSNAIEKRLPVQEAIFSIEPLCDEIVVGVLCDDDGTLALLRDRLTHPKFKIIKLQQSGSIQQTYNEVMGQCSFDTLFFIHPHEVLHENDLGTLHDEILNLQNRPDVLGLILKHLHFYKGPDYIINDPSARQFYRREVRVLKNHQQAQFRHCLQGFTLPNEELIPARLVEARIFHYDQLVHPSESPPHYQLYEGTHPALMSDWNSSKRQPLELHQMKRTLHFTNLLPAVWSAIENLTDYRKGEARAYKKVR
jgi:hypothetical protein